ncbi:hypothetical protein KAFR_0J02040 [Kazachstania africana CBS 2517]|uniref:Transcription factor TFIIIC triple barrel domain-containing protein n=1 Tax=Kazachstania africana (strain ATCC 22294 / BCRC 22015 / CBS 2517 / CECT 1963 / NBRC 1671 / NRRL Y-8276) TaxID=1071382 RepID=H2B0W8_KAZAF|nr:hypothetical protein KAFR_0J02040 [Kazachstania africana CBS 2517]CCF60268.1 hypothetical protein KAFR_0J02040 [Kazachstania africana CBS 2517]
MPIKTIYVARHGSSSAWTLKQEELPAPPTGVESDFPLSEHGISQSKELAHYILSLDSQPDMVISSPFFRCAQTSKYVCDLLELPFFVDNGLSEWFETDAHKPATADTLAKLFKSSIEVNDDNWKNGSELAAAEEGETEEELFQRCQIFLRKLVQKLETAYPDVETILLVTHGAVKVSLGLNLLGFNDCHEKIDDDGSTIRCGTCSLDKYEVLNSTHYRAREDEDDEAEDEEEEEINITVPFQQRKWVITMNGHTEFLRNGEERNWTFESDQIDEDGREEEMETVYISLDLSSGSYKERLEIDRTATFQYAGLDKEVPLFRIGDKLYEGNWQRLVGTELAFPDAAMIHKKKPVGGSGYSSDNENEIDPLLESKPIIEYDKEHTEKIYRIVDRLALTGLSPM